jgi:hypothetical protein
MMCGRCRKAVAAGGFCVLCFGVTAAGGPGGPITSAGSSRPAITARAKEHAAEHPEQPHTPELAGTELASPEMMIFERHVLVLDHPKYGLLNGRNYVGYCDTCPSALPGVPCTGPCPAEAA